MQALITTPGLAPLAMIGIALVVVLHGGALIIERPQRGLLLMAALVPLDGLLLIIPGGETVAPWKEVLLVVVLSATLVAPRASLRDGLPLTYAWIPAAAVMFVLSLISAVLVGGVVGFWGMKIAWFYILVPLVLWRCPFTVRDRDHLVTILMATGAITAAYGLVQQLIGGVGLNALGYEYNTAIRFSGGLLRSFSSFTQPFSFGLFITLVLLVCMPVALSDTRRTRNRVFLLLTPVLLAGLASSVVRGAYLALGAGLLFLAILRFRGMLHILVPAPLALFLVPPGVLAAFFSSSSLGQRTSGWSDIRDLVVGAPLGNGVGRTGAAAEKALELGAQPSEIILLKGESYLPDNQFVKTTLELGPVGLWLLLLIGAAAIGAALKSARGTTGSDRALAEGIAASVVAAAAASVVATYLEIFPLDFFFWLLLGVLLCYDRPSDSTLSPSVPEAVAFRPTSASSSTP